MRLSAMVWPVYACYTGGKTSYCLFSCNELRRFPKLATSAGGTWRVLSQSSIFGAKSKNLVSGIQRVT